MNSSLSTPTAWWRNDQKNQHYPPEFAVIGATEKLRFTCRGAQTKCHAQKSKQVSPSA
jgi:hypothetical protein